MTRTRRILLGALIVFVLLGAGAGVWAWWTLHGAKERIAAQKADLRASGAPLTYAEAVPPAVSDEENAAVLLRQAFRIFEEADAEYRRSTEDEFVEEFWLVAEPIDELVADPWIEDEDRVRDVRDWVVRRRAVRAPLALALERPGCRFDEFWVSLVDGMVQADAAGEDTADASIQRLQEIQDWLCSTAALAAREGDAEAAYGTILDALRLAGSAFRGDTLILLLLRSSAEMQALELLETVARRLPPPEEILETLRTHLERPEDPEGLARALGVERAQGLDVYAYLSEVGDEEGQPSVPLPQIAFLFDEDHYLGLTARAIALAGRPFPETREAWASFYDRELDDGPWYAILSRMQAIVFPRAAEVGALRLAALRLAGSALALEAVRRDDGTLPAGLCDTLRAIDPFDGRPIRCRPTGDGGYLLYSVGPDGVDQDGEGDSDDWRDGPDLPWRVAGRVAHGDR